ncbi:MAG: DUF5518 domain-containing protein [Candidatus Thorarchaeota archaeon]|jgi:hypothetical protein
MTTRTENLRLFGLILATAMLNVGLFFLFWIFTPIAAGFVCGYFMMSKKSGAIGGFIGGLLAYIPLELLGAPALIDQLVSSGVYLLEEIEAMLPLFYSTLILAAVILALVGAVGGYLGGAAGRNRSGYRTLSY